MGDSCFLAGGESTEGLRGDEYGTAIDQEGDIMASSINHLVQV